MKKFKAVQSGLRGAWYVGITWERGGYVTGLGGESILPRELPNEQIAGEVAAEMNRRFSK